MHGYETADTLAVGEPIVPWFDQPDINVLATMTNYWN